jgi:hypothetical protein
MSCTSFTKENEIANRSWLMTGITFRDTLLVILPLTLILQILKSARDEYSFLVSVQTSLRFLCMSLRCLTWDQMAFLLINSGKSRFERVSKLLHHFLDYRTGVELLRWKKEWITKLPLSHITQVRECVTRMRKDLQSLRRGMYVSVIYILQICLWRTPWLLTMCAECVCEHWF